MTTLQTRLADSAYDFGRVVWPVVQDYCGGGQLVPVESVTDSAFARTLDMTAGIDAWQLHQAGLRGIASRIQWTLRPYDTFTIRESTPRGGRTELAKRLQAYQQIFDGWLSPAFHIQAYVTERRVGELLSVAAVRTNDLMWLIEDCGAYSRQTQCLHSPPHWRREWNHDDSTFLVIAWKWLSAHGLDFFCWQRRLA